MGQTDGQDSSMEPTTTAIVKAATAVPGLAKSSFMRDILKILAMTVAPDLTLKALNKRATFDSHAKAWDSLDKKSVEYLAGQADIVQRHAARIYNDSLVQQGNLEAVVKCAIEEEVLRLNRQATEAPPSEDKPALDEGWRLKFTSFAQDISNEDLQRVWGRLLADEINKPGSTSFRAMRTLAEMQKADADRVADFAQHVINYDHVWADETWHSGPKFALATEMLSWGIAQNAVMGVDRHVSQVRGAYILKGNFKIVTIVAPDGPPKLIYPIIGLSKFGSEIVRLCGEQDDSEKLLMIARKIAEPLMSDSCLAVVSELSPNSIREPYFLWGQENHHVVDQKMRERGFRQ